MNNNVNELILFVYLITYSYDMSFVTNESLFDG